VVLPEVEAAESGATHRNEKTRLGKILQSRILQDETHRVRTHLDKILQDRIPRGVIRRARTLRARIRQNSRTLHVGIRQNSKIRLDRMIP